MSDQARLCGGCRFWGTDEEAAKGERFRTCRAIEHAAGDASHPEWAGNYMANHRPELLAGTMDSSDYHSCIVAREDFGCVLWEARP